MKTARLPLIVLVGGYLGAGKTSLILCAAGLLRKQGLRVAVITNDQDSGLVDTKLIEAQNIAVQEVTGGCFCCLFSDLLVSADQLTAFDPDVIFAEPVGSCVDICATVLQPLKIYHRDAYRVAPLTVLVDADLAKKVFSGQADADVSFLFRNQLAEADVLCVAKADLQEAPPALPVPVDFALSALSGQGVTDWLSEIMGSRRVAGARTFDVDYGRYAEAEAALGWLNLHAKIALHQSASPAGVVGPLLDRIDHRLTQAGIAIAHVKIIDFAGSGWVKASICVNGSEPIPEGDLAASPEHDHELVVNLRALGDPLQLEQIARAVLAELDGTVDIGHVNAFRPAPPRPEHRLPVTGDRTVNLN